MNATVTKAAKKTAAIKNPGKTAAKPGKIVKTKGAEKTVASTLKRVATKLAKKASETLKPAAKSAKVTAKIGIKTITKPGSKLVTKSSPKPVSQSAAKSAGTKKAPPAVKKAGAVKQPARTPVETGSVKKSAVKSAVAKSARPSVSRPLSGASEKGKSNPSMSGNKATVRSTDKIEKPVVPKVSEVATKLMKTTPAIVTDGALLSEEQILRMGEKDYMNAAQLAFFKARLQQLEKDLLKNADETTEHLRETVLVPDPADRATIEEEHALELRTRDRERKLLKKVQQSLASIESGDYGWCEETGEPIGIARLLARPTATLSLEAQQRRELKQKLYGD